MNYHLRLLFSVLFFACFLFKSISSAPAAPPKNADKPYFQIIAQHETLDQCEIKADKTALYICKDGVHIFQGDFPSDKYSTSIKIIDSVVDADMNDDNIIAVTLNRLTQLTLIDSRYKESYEDLTYEVPVLVRIKAKPTYSLVIMIYYPDLKFHKAENNPPQEGGTSGTRLLQDSGSDLKFIIKSFVIGGARHSHSLLFPSEDLEEALKSSSFKEATIYTDQIYGQDYFIVALQGGWVYAFRSFFEDPEFVFIEKNILKEGYEIRQMTSSEDYLFFIFQDVEKKELFLEIYLIVTINEFSLNKQCSIDLKDYYNVSDQYQLKVKHKKNTFLVLINLPGVQLLTYNFQKPTQGILPLDCPVHPYELNYHNATNAMGYSFDFIMREYDGGLQEHGILLSPSASHRDFSYFLPYCMPNYFMDEADRSCHICKDGFSQGGLSKSCQFCKDIVDKNHTLITGRDSMIQKCPKICRLINKFGDNCLSCPEYLSSAGVVLPEDAYPALDTNGECSFACRNNKQADKKSGKCLDELQVQISQNHCSQLTDCLNCTLSQSCSWCDGTCKQATNCPVNKKTKGDIMDGFFMPAIECAMEEPCGERIYKDAAGNITFSSPTVYKNQFCLWYPKPQYGDINEIQLSFHLENVAPNIWDNPPTIYMKYCEDQIYMKECQILSLSTEKKLQPNFKASNVVFFAWVEESLIGNARDFKLEYVMTAVPSLLEDLFTFLRLCSQLLFVLILLSFTVSTCQKLYSENRRRRLIRYMQGLDGIRLVEDGETGQVDMRSTAAQILTNNTILNMVVYRNTNNEYEQTECSICLEPFRTDEHLAKLVCKHIFHLTCFTEWVQAVNVIEHLKCPICNRILQ